MKKVYILEHLGCAHCAAKMESALIEVEGIDAATIILGTRQLKLELNDSFRFSEKDLQQQIQEICEAIEKGVRVIEKSAFDGAESSESELSGQHQHGGHGDSWEHTELFLGLGLFLLAILGLFAESTSFYLYVFAYLVLGGRIIVAAANNIRRGDFFDENFLMSIATLGAFVINEAPEAVGVMLFYRIGEAFEHYAVEKSRKEIMAVVDLRPEQVNLWEDAAVKVVKAAQVKVGQTILIKVGERVPLDGIVLEGNSQIDTSPLTGEPMPVNKTVGDELLSGCVNTTGVLKMQVTKVLSESMVTKILDSVENAAASKPQIEKFITRFAKIYTPIVVVIALIIGIIPSLVTGNWEYWIYTALTFLVISCPCALVLSVPLAFFAGIGAGSKQGILFKGGVVLEALKNIKAVALDKTGTVTKGNFVLQQIKLAKTGLMKEDELLRLCASAEQYSTHPLSQSILAEAKARGLVLEQPQAAKEIAGSGVAAMLQNLPIYCGTPKLLQEYGVDLTGYEQAELGTEVLVAQGNVFLGQLVIADTLKPDALAAVKQLHKLGLKTAMFTGDGAMSAQKIAELAGIGEVRAGLLPHEKLTALVELREKHGAVLFVGDGINDAPVLAGADVGAAMGSGSDAAIEVADVVFMSSEMQAVPKALAIARTTNKIAWQNVIFALGVKGVLMLLGVFGYASLWAAVFADSGVALLCVLNSVRILTKR